MPRANGICFWRNTKKQQCLTYLRGESCC